MITTMCIFGLFCVIIEMFLVTTFEGVENFMLKHEKMGLFFSIGLSWLVGEAFGAQGVIVLGAAMASTVVTVIIYKCHLLQYLKMVRNGELRTKMEPHIQMARKTIKFWIKFLTAPVRFFMFISHQINKTKMWLTATNIKIRKVLRHG